jgi:hypothetical protein
VEWKQNANVVMTNALEGEGEFCGMLLRVRQGILYFDRPSERTISARSPRLAYSRAMKMAFDGHISDEGF